MLVISIIIPVTYYKLLVIVCRVIVIICLALRQMTTSRLRKAFGKKVREIRKTKGFSQESLAEAADLHRTYIGSIERGEQNVSIDNIDKIAKALKVRPAALFDGL
jgi:ribosome-binding protein aMBF1 (putative translation factor)